MKTFFRFLDFRSSAEIEYSPSRSRRKQASGRCDIYTRMIGGIFLHCISTSPSTLGYYQPLFR